jgi:hypothetical protein
MHKKGSAPHESESLTAGNVAKNFRIHLEVHFVIVAIKCDHLRHSAHVLPIVAHERHRRSPQPGRLNVFDQTYRDMELHTFSLPMMSRSQ